MKRWHRPALLLGAWALAIAYSFPGKMSTDSIAQLEQARSGPIGDWHPPVMAVLWRYVDLLITGPFGMLVLQTAAFLFGLDALLRRVMGPRAAAATAGFVLLVPPVLAPMAVIWKDSQMAGYVLAGAALLLARRRALRVVGCGVLVVATAMRYNAVAATLPIVVLLFEWSWTGWRRYVAAIAVWLTISLAAMGVNRALTQQHDHAWHYSLAIFDLVGMVRYTRDYPDAQVERDLAGTPLAVHDDIRTKARKRYTPRFHWWMWHEEGRIFDAPETAEQRRAMEVAWWRLVTTHPGSYLRHRWKVFRELLGDSREGLIAPVWAGFVEADWHVDTMRAPSRYSTLQRAMLAAFDWASTTWLFMPRFYFLLALVLLAFCRTRLALALITSGLCYELSLFIAAPSADFRYSHWMIACTIIGAILVIAARARRGPRSSGSPARPDPAAPAGSRAPASARSSAGGPSTA